MWPPLVQSALRAAPTPVRLKSKCMSTFAPLAQPSWEREFEINKFGLMVVIRFGCVLVGGGELMEKSQGQEAEGFSFDI